MQVATRLPSNEARFRAREPFGPRIYREASHEIFVEPAAGCRLIHYKGNVIPVQAEERIVSRVILALVLGEEGADEHARQFAKDVQPLLSTWRMSEAQIRAWARRQVA